jgi:putative oxidoreductase
VAVAFMTGRFIFGGFFIMSGLHHLLSSQTMARFAAAKGVPAPEVAVVLTGLLILFGGVSILLGWRPELGLGAIAIFLIGVTPLMHNFWVEAGAERAADMGNFIKNMALLGGTLIISAVPRPWPYSVEERHLIRG